MTPLQTALAALENEVAMWSPLGKDDFFLIDVQKVAAAARRWLDLQPEECGTCGGSGDLIESAGFGPHAGINQCSVCHGSGHVYKTETVERIAAVIAHDFGGRGWVFASDYDRTVAIAVLDALNEADPPGKEPE